MSDTEISGLAIIIIVLIVIGLLFWSTWQRFRQQYYTQGPVHTSVWPLSSQQQYNRETGEIQGEEDDPDEDLDDEDDL